jgi:hypothetical protein
MFVLSADTHTHTHSYDSKFVRQHPFWCSLATGTGFQAATPRFRLWISWSQSVQMTGNEKQ